MLVYNTGRVIEDARSLVAEHGLPRPDYFICGVGTEIFHEGEGRMLEAWHEELASDWDFGTVFNWIGGQSQARPQPEEFQNLFKCSWFWEEADPGSIRELTEALAGQGIRAQAIYSSNRDLDFLPMKANKGNAISWLARQLGVDTREIVVAGDSGNDASMYQVDGVRGVLVANAEAALIDAVATFDPFHASLPCAAGVIEGLRHYLGQGVGFVDSEKEAS